MQTVEKSWRPNADKRNGDGQQLAANIVASANDDLKMPIVWQRHPRYAVFVFVVILTTFYLLNPYYQPPPLSDGPLIPISDLTLSSRLARSENGYQKMLEQRKGLIQRFGPLPKDVLM
jgi:hypothetical protein